MIELIVFLASFVLLAYFPHCLAHYIVGRVVGLDFSHFVLGSSPLKRINSPVVKRLDSLLPRLGIRLTHQSRKRANPTQRLLMFSSGVVTSTLLTLIPTLFAYSTITVPLNAILPVLWTGYLLFGSYFSPRYGDLSQIKTKPPQ